MINSHVVVPIKKEVKINNSDILWVDIINKNITELDVHRIQDNLNNFFPENQIIFIPEGHKLRLNIKDKS